MPPEVDAAPEDTNETTQNADDGAGDAAGTRDGEDAADDFNTDDALRELAGLGSQFKGEGREQPRAGGQREDEDGNGQRASNGAGGNAGNTQRRELPGLPADLDTVEREFPGMAKYIRELHAALADRLGAIEEVRTKVGGFEGQIKSLADMGALRGDLEHLIAQHQRQTRSGYHKAIDALNLPKAFGKNGREAAENKTHKAARENLVKAAFAEMQLAASMGKELDFADAVAELGNRLKAKYAKKPAGGGGGKPDLKQAGRTQDIQGSGAGGGGATKAGQGKARAKATIAQFFAAKQA